jgi:hypothetical protein
MGATKLLFYEQIDLVTNQIVDVMKEEIRSLRHDYLTSHSDEQIIEDFQHRHSLRCPEIYLDSAEADPLDTTVMNPSIRLEIPFQDPDNLLGYRTLNSNSRVLQFYVSGDRLHHILEGLTIEQANIEIERIKSILKENLEKLTTTVNAQNGAIPTRVKAALIERRKTANAYESNMAKLNTPLKKKDKPLFEIPPLRQQLIPKLPEPNSQDEPVLAEALYKHILEKCGDMARAMELSPSAFALLGEENLRVLFLVLLNGHYEGGMTAETFNFGGKTDICYRHKGRNLFIAECKIWDGATKHKKTIDQLRGYLSWGDSKTALIIFVRRKDFNKALENMFTATREHTGCLKELENYRTENSRRYEFTKDDNKQTFAMTVMAFHLPEETSKPEELHAIS